MRGDKFSKPPPRFCLPEAFGITVSVNWLSLLLPRGRSVRRRSTTLVVPSPRQKKSVSRPSEAKERRAGHSSKLSSKTAKRRGRILRMHDDLSTDPKFEP